MIYGVMLVLLGIVTAPCILLSKKPNAQQRLDKIAPYQGWAGIIFLLWGLFGVIFSIINIKLLTGWPIWWITLLAGALVELVLGFVLGYNLLNQYILSKNETIAAKCGEIIAKLRPMRNKLGLIGIAVGIWTIIISSI